MKVSYETSDSRCTYTDSGPGISSFKLPSPNDAMRLSYVAAFNISAKPTTTSSCALDELDHAMSFNHQAFVDADSIHRARP